MIKQHARLSKIIKASRKFSQKQVGKDEFLKVTTFDLECHERCLTNKMYYYYYYYDSYSVCDYLFRLSLKGEAEIVMTDC